METFNRDEDDADNTYSRKQSKKKQKRKVSTISTQEDEETKPSKTNKWKQSMAQITQMSDAQTDDNSQSVEINPSSTNKWKKSMAQMKKISEPPIDNNTQPVENNQPSTNKWKKSMAQIKKVSEAQIENNSQFSETNYLSTTKWKQSLAQIARMAKAQKDNNSQLLHSKATPNPMQITLDETDLIRSLQINEETDLQNDVQLDLHQTIEEESTDFDGDEKDNQDDVSDIDTTMDLSSFNLTDTEIPQIMDRILRQEKKDYTNLVLRDNALTSIGVQIIVDELLDTPRCLRNLGLSSNPAIGDEGIEHLVRLLQGNRTVTLLALHNTGITDRGVRLLADVLCNTQMNPPCKLKKLYMSFNKFVTDDSLEALIQILEYNQTLKIFSLQRCSLSDKARRRLTQIVAKKKKRKVSLAV